MKRNFGKFRQQVLAEKRFTKYLLYAAGEIVLVVIGILIALQINTWNDLRNLEQEERHFTEKVANDLRLDRERLAQVIETQTGKLEATRLLLANLGNPAQKGIAPDSVFYSLLEEFPTFYPRAGAYQAARSGNKISNYRNEAFLDALSALYDTYYARLVYNGEALDSRNFKLQETYKRELRTHFLYLADPVYREQLQDDLDWLGGMIEFYLLRCHDTLQELDKLLEARNSA